MTLDQIRYFMVTSQWLNFSRSAERLFMSQSNLTKQIAALEKELGFVLFDRDTHRVSLTEAGVVFQQLVSEPFRQINQAIERTRYTYGTAANRITVGVVEDERLPEWIYGMIGDYYRTLECRQLLLERNAIRDLRVKLLAGSYDLVITTENDVRGLRGICFQRLMRTQVTLAVRRDHPKLQKPHPVMKDFEDEVFIMATPVEEQRYGTAMERLFGHHGIIPNVQFVEDTESAVLNVEAGIGVAVIPSHVTVRPGSPIVFLPVADLEDAYLVAAWREDEHREDVMELIRRLEAGGEGQRCV